MGLKDAVTIFGIRKEVLEAKYTGTVGNNRFWLFVTNLVASGLLAVVFALVFFGLIMAIITMLILTVFFYYLDVTKAWVRISNQRRE